ncbi:ERMES complex subunit [Irineochytrium annulatum]|nr:ERMES complex subunit [Irineochytrium annulatum]
MAWGKFPPEFMAKAREQLAVALNKGDKPANIVDHIDVKELNMGTKPPDLEILEIGDLAEERFRGIFKLVYTGDASVVLQTKVQANPLSQPIHKGHIHTNFGMLAANLPLVVPMRLRISNLKLRGIIVLVVDKVKGITLVFKNDPLEKVDVNSTFDNIPNIRRFLQNQIEGQLRKMFQEDLPQLIHNLSLVLIQKKDGEGKSLPLNGHDNVSNPEVASGMPLNDSGYHSEEMDRTNRPHHQKWNGNELLELDGYSSDSEAQNSGYVLYRSLSISAKEHLGLQRLFDPPEVETLGAPVITAYTLKQKPSSDFSVRGLTAEDVRLEREQAPPYSDAGRYLRKPSIESSPSVRVTQSESGIRVPRYNGIHLKSSNGLLRPPRISSSATVSDYMSESSELNSVYSAQSSPVPGTGHYRMSSHLHAFHSPSSPRPTHVGFGGSATAGEEIVDRVVLQPSNNEVAAHLANLMNSNHTMSPHTHNPEHTTFRTFPHTQPRSPTPGAVSQGGNARRRVGTRTVRKLRLPDGMVVPGLGSAPSTPVMDRAGWGSPINGRSRSASRASSTRSPKPI